MSDDDRGQTLHELDELEAAIERQTAAIERQTAAIERQTAAIERLQEDVRRVSRPMPRRRSSTEDDVSGEVERLRREKDRMTADMQDMQDMIAEANAARAGSDMRHAKHRYLAKQANDQLHGGLAYAAHLWPGNDRRPADQEEKLRGEAEALAQIFRLLFAPETATQETVEGWKRMTDREPQALEALGEIRRDAEDLTHRIAAQSGEQRWIWDLSPPGVTFDKTLYDSWTQDDVGTVELVVLPAYFVDTMLVQKPVVLVTRGD